MCPASTVPLGTLRNGQKRCFPAFPAFLAFLMDSGGPSLHRGPEWTERAEVARMATFALSDHSGTLGTLDPDR